MKVLIVLMCAVIAIQARSSGLIKSTRSVAALGENPWLVHLRIAVSTSGLLNTGAGTLIGSSWVLTSYSFANDARFIWLRYGAVEVVNPTLVTESSAVRIPTDEANKLALISINRNVQYTDFISPVALHTSDELPSSLSKFCSFNEPTSEEPGEILTCDDVELVVGDENITVDIDASRFDLGAGLVSDGVQLGVLVATEDGVTTFARVAPYLEWIEAETGLELSSGVPAVVA